MVGCVSESDGALGLVRVQTSELKASVVEVRVYDVCVTVLVGMEITGWYAAEEGPICGAVDNSGAADSGGVLLGVCTSVAVVSMGCDTATGAGLGDSAGTVAAKESIYVCSRLQNSM